VALKTTPSQTSNEKPAKSRLAFNEESEWAIARLAVTKKHANTRTDQGVEDGERGRNRTFNLLIKSQLLCQLSYAPSVSTDRADRTMRSGRMSRSRFLV
jgi:hypothetical protein